MSKEFYYVNQIRNIDIEISNIEKKIYQLNKDLDNLYEFQTKHNQMAIRYSNQIDEHRNRLNSVAIKSQEVKFFSQYKDFMQSMLNGSQSQKILSQKEHEKHIILSRIREIENELEDLKQRKYYLEQELSDYNYLLRKERMNDEQFKNM